MTTKVFRFTTDDPAEHERVSAALRELFGVPEAEAPEKDAPEADDAPDALDRAVDLAREFCGACNDAAVLADAEAFAMARDALGEALDAAHAAVEEALDADMDDVPLAHAFEARACAEAARKALDLKRGGLALGLLVRAQDAAALAFGMLAVRGR